MTLCKTCNTQNPPGHHVCRQCGTALNVGEQPVRTTRPLDPATLDTEQFFEPFDKGLSTFTDSSRLIFNLGDLGQHIAGLRDGEEITFGRARESSFAIGESTAWEYGLSRHHAVIRRQGQHVYVIDLGSTNGTYVNNEPIARDEPYMLHDGDILRMGLLDMRLRFLEN